MRYLLMIYVNESPKVPEDYAETVDRWLAEMDSRGVRVTGSRLRPADETTTVAVVQGKLTLSDGPFAEAKEQVAGFDIIECNNLDEAITIAAGHPTATFAHIEVRAFWVE